MKRTLAAAIGAALCSLAIAAPARAEIRILDAYARVATPMSPTGAAFLVIENTGPGDDRLIGVTSDAAAKVELHTHVAAEGGVMQMRRDEDGVELPAGATIRLKRGGDHVMFMGLADRWADGDVIPVTLIFEKAGEIALQITVDLDRAPGQTGHAGMASGKMENGGAGMVEGAGHGDGAGEDQDN